MEDVNYKEKDKTKKNRKKKAKNNVEETKPSTKELFGEKFEINKSCMLGKGSFGEIYLAKDIYTNKQVVLKIEVKLGSLKQLKMEKYLLELLNGYEGFPDIHGFGSHGESNFIAMDVLGPNLANLFDYCNHHFSLQTVILIAIQCIGLIERIHSKYHIHRDIKPENFLIGIDDKTNQIYMIDFGLAKKYKDANGDHITYSENKNLTGTARYASINSHLGIEQSRRDDLESLGYMLVFFLKKSLPWQGINDSSKKKKYKKILEKKLNIPIEVLCNDLPVEFAIYLKYVQALRFTERPDYEYLKGIFTELLYIYYISPFNFDWNLTSHMNPINNIRPDPDSIRKQKEMLLHNKNKMAYIFTNSLTEEELNKKKIESNLKVDNKLAEKDKEEDVNYKIKIEMNDSRNNDFDKEDNRDDSIENTDQTEENSFYDEGDLINLINNYYKPTDEKK